MGLIAVVETIGPRNLKLGRSFCGFSYRQSGMRPGVHQHSQAILGVSRPISYGVDMGPMWYESDSVIDSIPGLFLMLGKLTLLCNSSHSELQREGATMSAHRTPFEAWKRCRAVKNQRFAKALAPSSTQLRYSGYLWWVNFI